MGFVVYHGNSGGALAGLAAGTGLALSWKRSQQEGRRKDRQLAMDEELTRARAEAAGAQTRWYDARIREADRLEKERQDELEGRSAALQQRLGGGSAVGPEGPRPFINPPIFQSQISEDISWFLEPETVAAIDEAIERGDHVEAQALFASEVARGAQDFRAQETAYVQSMIEEMQATGLFDGEAEKLLDQASEALLDENLPLGPQDAYRTVQQARKIVRDQVSLQSYKEELIADANSWDVSSLGISGDAKAFRDARSDMMLATSMKEFDAAYREAHSLANGLGSYAQAEEKLRAAKMPDEARGGSGLGFMDLRKSAREALVVQLAGALLEQTSGGEPTINMDELIRASGLSPRDPALKKAVKKYIEENAGKRGGAHFPTGPQRSTPERAGPGELIQRRGVELPERRREKFEVRDLPESLRGGGG